MLCFKFLSKFVKDVTDVKPKINPINPVPIPVCAMNTLQIPNQTGMLWVLQSFVVESARVFNLPEKLLEKLKLVSEEAFLHIIETAFAPDEESSVRITTQINNRYFELSFFDKGLPYDASMEKEFQPVSDVDSADTAGMELFLIKQFADHVAWVNHGQEGKEFRMLFEIPQQDIFTLISEEEKKPQQADIHIEDVEIRDFRESDAIKIARTIYRTYGYTYPNEDLYYPERIARLNATGELISVVCFDKNSEEVVGHYALERPGLGAVAESGQAVVAPDYRGFNLMGKMRDMLEAKAEILKLEGIMSQPVTSHVYSQKVNLKFGSRPCGFTFGLVPRKLSFKQINQSLSQRESCMLFFKPFSSRKRKIYLPAAHREIITKIYRFLDLDFQEEKTNPSVQNQPGKVTSNYNPGWGFGEIWVKEPGTQNLSDIKQALYNLLYTMKAEVIFLYIPLEGHDFTELIQPVEKEKCFFSSVIPSCLDGKDVLKFQYLNGSIDASKIEIYGEAAQEIFNYVCNEKERMLS